MTLTDPLWPSLSALDDLWAGPIGWDVEQEKARLLTRALSQGIPGRPKTLIIGALSDPLHTTLMHLRPQILVQAYPPPLGLRPGPDPALMMDTDLPPFARGAFDLVLINHVLEYRSTPLALLSLVYEILAAQGRLLTFVPQAMQPQALHVGHGQRFWGWQMTEMLRRAAFTPLQQSVVRVNGWRPACLLHLAAPQVPPRPTGLRPAVSLGDVLLRLRRLQGIAAGAKTGFRARHDPTDP